MRTFALSAAFSSMNSYKVPTTQEITDTSERKAFSVVSLFAGGGGSSTGYRMAGGHVLAINEFIPEACKTYAKNWPSTPIIYGDIKAITADEIMAAASIKAGELDILDGSPPCSAFSIAGKRSEGWGKTKAYSDTKQTSVEDLFFEYVRILEGVQPKMFVAENVAGLAKGNARGYLNDILKALRGAGYNVEARILDALYLGVPQSRSRLIFVGVRNDLWRQEYKGKLHPKPQAKIFNLREAFEGLENTQADLEPTDIRKYAIYRELIKLKMGAQSKKYFQLVKAHPENPSGCITASSGASSIACIRHWENRAFTVREVKRIMSIPDDYILTGTYAQKVERMGRMVAPFMMKAVAENILSLGVLNENS